MEFYRPVFRPGFLPVSFWNVKAWLVSGFRINAHPSGMCVGSLAFGFLFMDLANFGERIWKKLRNDWEFMSFLSLIVKQTHHFTSFSVTLI